MLNGALTMRERKVVKASPGGQRAGATEQIRVRISGQNGQQFYVPILEFWVKGACKILITRICRWNGILFESPVNPQKSLCRFGAIPYQDWV